MAAFGAVEEVQVGYDRLVVFPEPGWHGPFDLVFVQRFPPACSGGAADGRGGFCGYPHFGFDTDNVDGGGAGHLGGERAGFAADTERVGHEPCPVVAGFAFGDGPVYADRDVGPFGNAFGVYELVEL